MHNIKDTITHYKQGRGPRRNGNRKLKRSDWCSWRTWPLHVECVLSHTHTKVCLPSAVCVCVWQKKGSLLQSQCDSSWMPLSADGSWHPGGQTGRMDEKQPPSQRKDARARPVSGVHNSVNTIHEHGQRISYNKIKRKK